MNVYVYEESYCKILSKITFTYLFKYIIYYKPF